MLDIVVSSANIILADNLDKVGPSSLHVLEFGIMLNISCLCERQCRGRFGVFGPICSEPICDTDTRDENCEPDTQVSNSMHDSRLN